MKTRTCPGSWLAAGAVILLVGCGSSPTPDPSATAGDSRALAEDVSQVAERVLGNQAEVAAHGNLARNGREQLLVFNRLRPAPPLPSSSGQQPPLPSYITRAAILEKDGQKWTEVFHSDEHLMNPVGYLTRAQATAWRFEFRLDQARGLELRFTAADIADAGDTDAASRRQTGLPPVVVRWNERVKRYQCFDESQMRFLSEAPTLETPQSKLR